MVAVFDDSDINIDDISVFQDRRLIVLTVNGLVLLGRDTMADYMLIDVQIDFGKP